MQKQGVHPMTEHTSEIASLRQRIELEEAAAVWGLYGPAIVASHESITARMERAAEHILHLVEAGKHEEAFALMNMPAWGVEERSVDVGDDRAVSNSGMWVSTSTKISSITYSTP
jgi:hypothetical protein